MDWQSAFNVTAGVAGAVGGWLMRIIWESMRDLQRQHDALEAKLPEIYARRDDVAALAERMDRRFDRLDEKLDRIVGK